MASRSAATLLYFFLLVVFRLSFHAGQPYNSYWNIYQDVNLGPPFNLVFEPTTQNTYESFGQFSVSCTPPSSSIWDYSISPLTPYDPLSPPVKLLSCNNFANGNFTLTYNVTGSLPTSGSFPGNTDPQTPVCIYTVSYSDCKEALANNVQFPASTIWYYTQYVQNMLHGPALQNNDIGPANLVAQLCDIITAANSNLVCTLPYLKQNIDSHSPCVLAQYVNYNCFEHQFNCTISAGSNPSSATCTDIFYDCQSLDTSVLSAFCPGVPLGTMQTLLSGSQTQTFGSCTTLRNQYCMQNSTAPYGEFICALPRLLTTPEQFCELSTSYTNVQPFCGSNGEYTPITCYSTTGENGTHTCVSGTYNPYNYSQYDTVANPVNLYGPIVNVNCMTTDASYFLALYEAAQTLFNADFPGITIEQYTELFCNTTFQACPLWQLDGLHLLCNQSILTGLGIDQTLLVTRRRLLSALSAVTPTTSSYGLHQDPSSLNTYIRPPSPFNLEDFVAFFQAPVSVQIPVTYGFSSCIGNVECNHDYMGSYTSYESIDIAERELAHPFTTLSSTESPKFHPAALTFHLLMLNKYGTAPKETVRFISQQLKKAKYDPYQMYVTNQRHGRGLKQANPCLVGVNLVWTKECYAAYFHDWCEYGKTEQILCYNISHQICAYTGATLNCNGTDGVNAIANGLNPVTYCSTYLNPNCSVTGRSPPTYTFFCPATPTFFHTVGCTIVDAPNCVYACSVNNFYLILNFVEMTGNYLLDSPSDTQRCQILNDNWAYIPGSCEPPFTHSSELLCYFNSSQPVYVLQCGAMSIECNETYASSGYYACISSSPGFENFGTYSRSAALQHVANHSFYGLVADSVPLQYVQTDGDADLTTLCINFRTYVKAQAVTSPSHYAYFCDTKKFVDNNIDMCQSALNVTTYPFIYNLNCTDNLWTVNCHLNGDTFAYACLSNVAALQMRCTDVDQYGLIGQYIDFDGPNALTNASLPLWTQQCLTIRRACHTEYKSDNTDFFACDPTHYFSNPNEDQFCDPNGLFPEGNALLSSQPVTTYPVLNLPMFYCGVQPQYPIYCSNALSQSSNWYRCSNDWTRIYTPAYLGNLTLLNQTVPYINYNYSASSSLLAMDCLYHANVLINEELQWAQDFINSLPLNATAQSIGLPPGWQINVTSVQTLSGFLKPEICQILIYQCAPFVCSNGIATTTLASTSIAAFSNISAQIAGNQNASMGCPAPIYQVIDCHIPAQLCDNVFCQLSGVSRNASAPTPLNTCTFSVGVYNLSCNGYNVMCTRLDVEAPTLNAVEYLCQHTGPPDYPSLHFQSFLVTINQFGYSSVAAYEAAIASLVTNSTNPGWLNQNCLVQAAVVEVTNNYVQQFDAAKKCVGLSQADCTVLAQCTSVGTYCVEAGLQSCSNGAIATASLPYCQTSFSLPTLDETFFTCNDMGVQCYLPKQCNTYGGCVVEVPEGYIFCTSITGNGVWLLAENINGLQDALNTQPGLTSNTSNPGNILTNPYQIRGCQMPIPFFYQDPVTRCSVLYDNCKYECLNPHFVPPDGQTMGTFCDRLTRGGTVFECDATTEHQGQWIACELVDALATSGDVNAANLRTYFSTDPNFALNQRMMQCTAFTPPDAYYNDTLLLSCLINERQFVNSTVPCQNLVTQCAANGGTIKCLNGYIATPEFPFCTTPAAVIVPSPDCNCGLCWSTIEGQNRWPASLDPSVMTCEKRGMISVPHYLLLSGTTLTMADLQANSPGINFQYWCLESMSRPTVTCATLPGQRLPMCTVECPLGLVPTTLGGSTSTYCCLEAGGGSQGCSVSIDARQCVLGQHDAALFLANPSLFPDQACPENLFNRKTAFPLSSVPPSGTGLDDPLADVKHLCEYEWECEFIVPITITINQISTVGIYFSRRPAQLSLSDLQLYFPQRLHTLDTESIYHGHPVPNSQLAGYGSPLQTPGTNSFITSVTTYFMDRYEGLGCTDRVLRVLDLANHEPLVLNAALARLASHLAHRALPPTLMSLLTYQPSRGFNDPIFTNFLNTQQIYSDLFVVDILENIAFDLNMPYPNGVVNSNISDQIIAELFQYGANFTDNNVYPSALSIPILGMLDNSVPVTNNIPQTFLPDNAETFVPNTCLPLPNPNFNLVQRYQDLVIEGHNSPWRYQVPLFGTSQNQLYSKVLVYDQFEPPFLEVSRPNFDPSTDTDLLGHFDILDDSMYLIKFNTTGELFMYFMWWEWKTLYHRSPQDFDRIGPNANCDLSHPLWFSYPLPPGTFIESIDVEPSRLAAYTQAAAVLRAEGAVTTQLPYPICVIARCPLPVDPTDWQTPSIVTQLDPSSNLPFNVLYPNPPEAALLREPRSCPCNVDHGICISPIGGLPIDGHCACFSSFQTDLSVSPYLLPGPVTGFRSSQVPRCLKMFSCDSDNRQACYDVTNSNLLKCHGHGICGETYTQGIQQAGCFCGAFPPGCNGTQECDSPFLLNGFTNENAYLQCQVPRDGCRFDYDTATGFVRTGGLYEPTFSFGPELPRMNDQNLVVTGQCLPQNAFETVWAPKCKPGYYGAQCEYIGIQGGCFDQTDLLYQELNNQHGSTQTSCVYDPFLIQFETIQTAAVYSNLIFGYSEYACGGILCSNRTLADGVTSVCMHPDMNNPALDVYKPDPSGPTSCYAQDVNDVVNNPYTHFSSCRLAFVQAAQTRLSQQFCACPIGTTGKYCQYNDCIGGCGIGYCVRSTDPLTAAFCVCPASKSGHLLVQGASCQGPVCGGHGNLTLIALGTLNPNTTFPPPVYQPTQGPVYSCTCNAPWYQGASLTTLCASFCPGQLISAVPASTATTAPTVQAVLSQLHIPGIRPVSTPTPPPAPSTTVVTSPSAQTQLQNLICVCTTHTGQQVACDSPLLLVVPPVPSSSSSSSSSTGHSSSSSTASPSKKSSSSSSSSSSAASHPSSTPSSSSTGHGSSSSPSSPSSSSTSSLIEPAPQLSLPSTAISPLYFVIMGLVLAFLFVIGLMVTLGSQSKKLK